MEYYLISNTGNREHNEDAAIAQMCEYNGEESMLFALADGLGGHGRGEVASALVTETAREIFQQAENMENLLKLIFEESQKRLLTLQKKEHAEDEMKTTAVILLVTKQWMQWGHIGDSRLYFFRNGMLVKRTLDHSVPQMLVISGEIRESQIRNHPDRNRLLKVMGVDWEKPGYTISEVVKRKGNERFLLCSDGFWENIKERNMIWSMWRNKSAKEWLIDMDKMVQKNGTGKDMDNNTAIAVKCNFK